MQNRIKEFRKKAKLSLAELATITGTSAQQLNRLEQGKRRLNTDNIMAIARALNVSSTDLLQGQKVRIPVIGKVGAGAEVYPFDDLPLLPRVVSEDEQEYINCSWIEAPPGVFPGGVVALRVEGDSMMPFMPEGTIVYYAERFDDGAPEHCIASLCVVQLRDGKTLLKMVRKGHSHGRFDLQSYNMNTITDIELAWCAPVIFIKPFLASPK